jgi:ferric-dicitrate binding protein FerR (iron transport regulator)
MGKASAWMGLAAVALMAGIVQASPADGPKHDQDVLASGQEVRYSVVL